MAGVAFAIATTFFMDRQCHTTLYSHEYFPDLEIYYSCSLAVAMSRSRLSIPSIAMVMTDTVWLEHEANDSRLPLPRPLFSKI